VIFGEEKGPQAISVVSKDFAFLGGDRWFESASLHLRVRGSPTSGAVGRRRIGRCALHSRSLWHGVASFRVGERTKVDSRCSRKARLFSPRLGGSNHALFASDFAAAGRKGRVRPQDARPRGWFFSSWSGVLDRTKFGSHCAQIAHVVGTSSSSEDCLFLNVYVPDGSDDWQAETGNTETKGNSDRSGRAVMVWIHGGAFVAGESADFDASRLASIGGVIVITINYRLGVFGFLAHPATGIRGLTNMPQLQRGI
jgi:hypothetical protein